MFMMPKTSVRPAAIRNSVTPSWRPLSVCSRTRKKTFRTLPLHPAFLVVGVLVILEDGLLDLHLDVAGDGDGAQEVEVLDREVVHVVRVLAACGLVVGLPHRRDHALLVREVALHRPHGRVDQHDAVVGLGAVEDGRLAELLLEVRDVARVGLVLEIGGPVARLVVADRVFLHRRQRDLVHRVDGVERDLTAQPRLRVLLEELDAHVARVEDEDGLRALGAELADLGLDILPASSCGPAFVPIMNVPASVTVGATASITFDQMMPLTKWTLCFFSISSASCLPTSGLRWSSP